MKKLIWWWWHDHRLPKTISYIFYKHQLPVGQTISSWPPFMREGLFACHIFGIWMCLSRITFLLLAGLTISSEVCHPKIWRASFDGDELVTVGQKPRKTRHRLPVGHNHLELATFPVGVLYMCHILESGSLCPESRSLFWLGRSSHLISCYVSHNLKKPLWLWNGHRQPKIR